MLRVVKQLDVDCAALIRTEVRLTVVERGFGLRLIKLHNNLPIQTFDFAQNDRIAFDSAIAVPPERSV